MNTAATKLPWYRQPWPWLVISLPAAAVVASLFSAYLAFRGADPVIEDNYYQRGLDINSTLQRVQQAAALGLHASVVYDGLRPGQTVWVRIHSDKGIQDPSLQIRLIHPARGGDDRQAVLARTPASADGDAEYTGQWPDGAGGATSPALEAAVNWRIVVTGRDWQLEGDAAGRNDLAVR